MIRHKGRLKRRVAHALRRITRGATGRRSQSAAPCASSSRSRGPSRRRWPARPLMGLVDTKLVGGLGPAALGGVGVAMTVVFLGYMVVFGLMRGVKVCVAHAVGRGRRARRACATRRPGSSLGLVAGTAVRGWARATLAPAVPPRRHRRGARAPRARRSWRRSPSARPGSARRVGAHAAPAGRRRRAHAHGRGPRRQRGQRAARVVAHLRSPGLPALGVRGGGVRHGDQRVARGARAARAARARRAARPGAYAAAPAPSCRCVAAAARGGPRSACPPACSSAARCSPSRRSRPCSARWAPSRSRRTRSPWRPSARRSCPERRSRRRRACWWARRSGAARCAEADRATRAALASPWLHGRLRRRLRAWAGGSSRSAFTDDPAVAHVARTLLWIAAAFQVLDAVEHRLARRAARRQGRARPRAHRRRHRVDVRAHRGAGAGPPRRVGRRRRVVRVRRGDDAGRHALRAALEKGGVARRVRVAG